MMKRRTQTLLTLWLVLGFGWASAQSVTLTPSRHGVEGGETRKTLVALELSDLPNTGDLEIDFTLTGKTPELVTSLELLISDVVLERDVNDYPPGWIAYTVIPVAPSANSVSIPIERLGKNRVLYLTADLATPEEFSILNRLTCTINSVSIDGKEVEMKQQGAETSRRFFRLYRPLYVPGDNGSRNYRIPAILRTSKGTLLAVADRRKFNQIDIPEDIDLVVRRSYDNGTTWTDQGEIVVGRGWGAGYGDAALVETASGKIVLLCVGGQGLWRGTPEDPMPTYLMTSDDDGITWSKPRDITPFLYGKDCDDPVRSKFYSSFCASGQGLRTSSGRIIFVAAMRTDEQYKLDNYAIYSDDEGETWQVSDVACIGGDESKVIQLHSGAILMSIRNPKREERIFKLSYDDGQTWQETDAYAGLHDPAVDGAPLLVQWQGKTTLLHSLPIGPRSRTDGAVYIYDEDRSSWSEPILINPGMSAYSDMVLIDEETIGYFVEEDDQMSLVFITFTTDDLAQLQEESRKKQEYTIH
ncbi:MAG: sialidase family protein [Porphyromonas sp.]|nr:sialidase family protein [Porphyromonas sp.]